MAALVTLDRAKKHLRITDNDHDDDVLQKIEAASEVITKYYGTTADPAWDTTNPPPAPVVHAVLVLLTHLYENRGDGMDADADVWLAIRNLLAASKAPALG
jgi:Phage gp6-like head-tail connector protein